MEDNGGENRNRRVWRQRFEREERALRRQQQQRDHEEREEAIRIFNLAERLLQEIWQDNLTVLVRRELVRMQDEESFIGSVLLLLDQIQPINEEHREEFESIIANGEPFLYSIITSTQQDLSRLTSVFRWPSWPTNGFPYMEIKQFMGASWATMPTNLDAPTLRLKGFGEEEIQRSMWLNELKAITRLNGPDDYFAFNAFVQFNLEPDWHWVGKPNSRDNILNRFRFWIE